MYFYYRIIRFPSKQTTTINKQTKNQQQQTSEPRNPGAVEVTILVKSPYLIIKYAFTVFPK
jgi:hypothetical protein